MNFPGRDRFIGGVRRMMPLLMSGVAVMLIAWVYVLGIRSERTGFVDRVLDPGIKRLTHPVLNAFRGRPPEVPQLLVTWPTPTPDSLSSRPWIPVIATFNRDTMAAWVDGEAIRTGDGPLRLRMDPGPWRMTTFTARPITSIAPVWTWWATELWREMGGPVLATDLVELDMGTVASGLHLLEQQMDSAWLAHHGASVAVALDDALLANARHMLSQRRYPAMVPPQADWTNAPVRVVQALHGVDGALAVQRLVDKLEAFRRGTVPASQVLEPDAAARALALCDVLGAGATMAWWNLWFVPDSASGLMRMVPMQMEAGRPTDTLQVLRTSTPLRWPMGGTSFHDRLFGDPVIYQAYVAYLDTFSRAGNWSALIDIATDALELRHRMVQAEFPGTVFDMGVMEHGRTLAHQALHPEDPALVYTQGSPDRYHRLVGASVHSLPVVVHGVVVGTDTLPARPPHVLWPRPMGSPLAFEALHVAAPARSGEPVSVLMGVHGVADTTTVSVRTWSTLPASRTP